MLDYRVKVILSLVYLVQSCHPSCLSCDDAGVCNACEDGLYLTSNKTCDFCHESCLTCKSESWSECLSCIDGYAKNSLGKCASCPFGCNKCEEMAINAHKHDIESGLIRRRTQDCPGGSGSGSGSRGDPDHMTVYRMTCMDCTSEFDAITDKYGVQTCRQPCSKNCKTCDKIARKCVECYPGQYIDVSAQHQCKFCDKSCLTCTGDGSNSCESCNDGLYLTNNTCEWCDKSCRTCTGSGSGSCLACAAGYYNDTATSQCAECNENCLTCDAAGANDCTSCRSDSFLSENKACEPCDKSCSTCTGSGSGSCLACAAGYYNDTATSQCAECDKSCSTCTGSGSGSCLACAAGYYNDTATSQCAEINYSILEENKMCALAAQIRTLGQGGLQDVKDACNQDSECVGFYYNENLDSAAGTLCSSLDDTIYNPHVDLYAPSA